MIDYCVCDAENKLFENGLLEKNGKVKFITGSYAVMECVKDIFYTYYAVNLHTLKKKYLSKRKNAILQENDGQLARRVHELNNQEAMTLQATKYDRAKDLLCHIFLYILPTEGFSFRKTQLDLALDMLDGLVQKNISLLEAEVGTGKTHAYLITAVIYKLFYNLTAPIVISTSTIALQKAITEEYIPQISDILLKYRILRAPLNFVVRKGKGHYICDLKLKTYLASIEKNNVPRDKPLISLLRRLLNANEQDIDLDTYPLTRYVKERICVTQKCSTSCSYSDRCRFICFINDCLRYKYCFQIANHNYVLADLMSSRPLLPEYRLIIFDEAHKLYDAAKQMYGCFLAASEFAGLIRYMADIDAKGLEKLAERIQSAYPKLFDKMTGSTGKWEQPCGRKGLQIDAGCIRSIKTMAKLLEGVCQAVYACDEITIYAKKRKIERLAAGIKEKLQPFLSAERYICWYESGQHDCMLCALPKNLDRRIYADLWKRDVLSVLTSGTLSASGDFGFIKRRLGVDRLPSDKITETSKKSPFQYRENTLLYIPEHVPFPNTKREGYVRAVTNEIDRLLKAAYGHALVLFTSYRMMELVFNAIPKDSYGYPFFIMGRGRIDALKEFKISGNGVLFASDIAGEGVDIAGDTLSNLIIVKLPFAAPDPISEYEQAALGGLDAYLQKINTPNMLIKLKQYAGRLIRSEQDTGIIAILDSRANSKGKYRETILESLFDTYVTSNITDVERFIMEKKDKSYFE